MVHCSTFVEFFLIMYFFLPISTYFCITVLIPFVYSLRSLCLSSIYKACDRPPELPQYQFQPGREDDGDPGPRRLDHQTQQQGREPPHCHLEGKKQIEGYSWAIKGKIKKIQLHGWIRKKGFT